MAQLNYDATYEHHDTYKETTFDDSEADFFDWDEAKRLTLQSDNPLLLPFFNSCYYKTLECSIYHRSMGIEITDLQLIVLCNRMLNS